MINFRNYLINSFLLLASVFAPVAATAGDIKAIIFDCDGTLVDTDNALYLAWEYAFNQQGYVLSKDEYQFILNKYSLAGHPTSHFTLSKIGAELVGRDCAQVLLEDVRWYASGIKNRGYPPIQATVDFLHRLAKEKEARGIKIGLASGATKQQILGHLKHLGIEHYFDIVLSGNDDLSDYVDAEGTNKPKPYIYMHAAKLFGLLPAQCVAIEDSWVGVASAVDAGCVTIAVPNNATQKHDLSRAHFRIESFEGMSVNDFLQLIANPIWAK